MILCSEKAQERINNNLNPTYYQNLKRALKDGERGQTPSHLQSELSCSYMKIIASFSKGIEQQIQKTQELATYFRKKFLNIILNLLPLLHQTQSRRYVYLKGSQQSGFFKNWNIVLKYGFVQMAEN